VERWKERERVNKRVERWKERGRERESNKIGIEKKI
jgi:hypothetical protein